MQTTDTILKIEHLEKRFPIRGGILGREVASVKAVRGIDLEVPTGQTLGLVGESGCGKSTLGMLILRLLNADSGRIVFDGGDITSLSQGDMRPIRRDLQVVFQDPYASLNPRMRIGEIVAEPMLVHGIGDAKSRRDKVYDLLGLVGLGHDAYTKYPHEFSGGQRQRVGIARAIALNPKFILADEPVSALDVSIRGEILNLLDDLRNKFSLTYLFISHDLKVVEHISHRVAVMYLGKLMEIFPADGLTDVKHPYTRALVEAVPVPDPEKKRNRIILKGDVPSPISPPSGCPFHPRCQHAKDICWSEEPKLASYGDDRTAACHFIGEF